MFRPILAHLRGRNCTFLEGREAFTLLVTVKCNVLNFDMNILYMNVLFNSQKKVIKKYIYANILTRVQNVLPR